MNVFKRMGDIISSNVNSALDKMEDPKKMINLMITEMEDTEREIKVSIAEKSAELDSIKNYDDNVRQEMISELERRKTTKEYKIFERCMEKAGL